MSGTTVENMHHPRRLFEKLSIPLTDYPDNPFSANTPQKVLEGSLLDALKHCVNVGDCAAFKWLLLTFQITAEEIKSSARSLFHVPMHDGNLDMCRLLVKELSLTKEDVVCSPYADSPFQVAAQRGYTHICQWLVNEFSLTKQDIKGRKNGFPIAMHYTPPLDTCVWLTDAFNWTRQDVSNKNLFDAIRGHNTEPRMVLWLICRFGVSLDEIGANIHPWFLMSVSDMIEALDPVLVQEVRNDNVRHCEKGSWVIRQLAQGFGNSRDYWMRQAMPRAVMSH